MASTVPLILERSKLVISLWAGLFVWELIQSIPFDWKIVRGQRGCVWGALVAYFPFRILAVVSFVMSILGAYPLSTNRLEAIGYIQQSTNVLSRVLVFYILGARVIALWKQRFMGYLLSAVVIVLMIVSLYGISRIQGVWFGNVMPSILAVYFLSLTTVYLVLTIFGLHRARALNNFSPPGLSHRYADNSLWHIAYAEQYYWIAAVWVSESLAALYYLSGPSSADTATTIGMTNFLVIIVSGSRTYQHMIAKGSTCPSILSTILRGTTRTRQSNKEPVAPSSHHKARRSDKRGRALHEGRINIQDTEAGKDVIELQTLPSNRDRAVMPSSSRLSLKTIESVALSSNSEIQICKRTPSPSPSEAAS